MKKNVIFDLGGVLIDWNPRYFYRSVFNDDARMEDFLGMLGLSDRFIHSEDSFVESSDIDYKQVDQIINEKRNLSRNWLLDQLKY